jgi:hypothetical protein
MNKREIGKAELPDLISAFREAGRVRGANLEDGNYRIGNKAADLAGAIYLELRRRGEESQKALLPLLADEDRGVRLEAATFVLDFAPREAVPVLEALIPVGFVGLMAKMVVFAWRRGDYKIGAQEEGAGRQAQDRDARSMPSTRKMPTRVRRPRFRNQRSSLKIGQIDVRDVLAGKNWRFVPAPDETHDAPMEEWDGVQEIGADRLEEEDQIIYSGLYVTETSVRPLLMLKEIGDYEFGGDYCRYDGGRWRQLGLEPDPDAEIGDEYYADPSPLDPSFEDAEERRLHRRMFKKNVGRVQID